MNLTFPTITNRVYTVLYSNSLIGTYLPLASGIVGTGGKITVTDDGSVTGSAPQGDGAPFLPSASALALMKPCKRCRVAA